MNYEDKDEGVELGVSEDAFEQDPVLKEHQTTAEQAKWQAELKAARDERRKFDQTAVATIKRYSDTRDEAEAGQSHFNVFFEVTDIKQAALYGRTPVPDVKRRFNDPSDDVSRVAATLQQRSLSYELECDNFDATIKKVIFDRLVPGFGVGWVRLEDEREEQEIQQPPVLDPLTQQPIPQAPIIQEVVVNQFAHVDYVAWSDFLWSPCQVWELCPWIGRRVPMTKKAVEERFSKTAPKDTLAMLAYAKRKDTDAKDGLTNLGPKHTTESTVDIYELWDKERRLTFWIAESADVPLDIQGDRNEFPNFYPTPLPPLGRFTTANTIPVSDYVLVQDLYNQLDNLTTRRAGLIAAMKLRFMYDGANEELADLYTSTPELEGVPVKNISEFIEKGGMAGAIHFAPLNEIASALQATNASIDAVKAQIYEIEGMNGLLRAEAMPYESAQATSTKAQFGSSRLSVMQRDLAEYIAELIRLKAHLMGKFYTPEFIMKRAGVLPQPDMKHAEQAIALLKDPEQSHFRIGVSTDAISLPDWNAEKADKTAAIQALSNLLPQLVGAAEKIPALGAFGAQTIRWLITGFKGAEEIEGFLDEALERMQQEQAKKATEPPKPTPEQVAMQEKQAEIQAELQKQQIKGQIDVQVASIQAQAKVQAAQMQAEVEAYKNRIKEMQASVDARFRQMELQLEAFKAANDSVMTRAA